MIDTIFVKSTLQKFPKKVSITFSVEWKPFLFPHKETLIAGVLLYKWPINAGGGAGQRRGEMIFELSGKGDEEEIKTYEV